MNLLYSGGTTCYPIPARRRRPTFTNDKATPTTRNAPTLPMSRRPTSMTADLPVRLAPAAPTPIQPTDRHPPRNPIPFDAATASARHQTHPRRRPTCVLPLRPPPTDASQPSFSLFSTSTLLPARSPPTLCAWPHQNICDVVGRGRGSPGWSAKRRGGDPLPQCQAQSQISPASGQQGVRLGCSPYRRTPKRTPRRTTPHPKRRRGQECHARSCGVAPLRVVS